MSKTPTNRNVLSMTTELFDRLGRLALAALFIGAVPGKITNFTGTAAGLASKGLPLPLANAMLLGAIVLLTLGSVLLVFGSSTRLGAVVLLVFLVPTTLLFHTNPPDAGLLRNISLAGALLLAMTRPRRVRSSH